MVCVTVLAGLVQLHNLRGTVTGSSGEVLSAAEEGAPVKQVEKLAQRFAKYCKPIAVKAKPAIPGYPLPLDTGKVVNLKYVAEHLPFPMDEPSLKANGFVVLPGQGNEDIVAPYTQLKNLRIPIFITADTLLHLYHVQFDETLKDIEEREFYPDIVALTETLVTQLEAMKLPADDADFSAAHQKLLTYFAVALKSFKPEARLPKQVEAKDVDLVLEKMKKHEGFWPDHRVAHNEWPLFRYSEDFSQYVPRGHYTRSDSLKKYFAGMMWYGRMTFILKGDGSYGPDDQPALVSVPEARQQTLAAALVTRLLNEAVLPDRRTARAVWERIYAVTSFYVGLADDLGLQEYQAALLKVCGAALDLGVLANDNKFRELQVELARHAPPAIYSGSGAQGTYDPSAGPEKLLQILSKTQGFRFMGQRFVPDSYMMGKLVYPTVGRPTRDGMFTYVRSPLGPIRGFPRGLDVMAVLGSGRARELLRELGDDAYHGGDKALSYDDSLAALKKEYGKLNDADWNRNLYWSWLHALKPLLNDHGAGYQTFMTTSAYRTKSLNTALASWAQLRHDTILYAKQSYTPGPRGLPPTVEGYVEPIPEFYARLLTLSRMTSQGLTEMKVLDKAAATRLAAFDKLLERLLAISEKELANENLTREDYAFIRNFGTNLESVIVTEQPREDKGKIDQTKPMKTTLIADVHTDQTTRMVLEEGTGYVDLGLFVYRQPDGQLVIGAGPVLSYYEFKHPMKDRLTDEKWRELLQKPDAPGQPEWTQAYLSTRTRYRCQAEK
jgi:hypothetical protein